jgi:hypothetical protein
MMDFITHHPIITGIIIAVLLVIIVVVWVIIGAGIVGSESWQNDGEDK